MNARARACAPVALTVLFACGSSSGGGAGPADAAPTSDSGTPVVVQSGRIVKFGTTQPVAGATIVAGTQTATSGADGKYTLDISQSAHFAMTVTAPGYIKLIEQASSLDADRDRGDTSLPSTEDSNLLKLALPKYDGTLGVLSIEILPVGRCARVAGAKVHVEASGARIAYVVNGLPLTSVGAAKDDELPTAVIYDLPPGQSISVQVDKEDCTLAPFPYVYKGITYYGDVTTEPGDATSFARYFLE